MPTSSTHKSKFFCFTLNNYTNEEIQTIKTLIATDKATYVVLGFEQAPLTGTRHIQGYIEFSGRLRLTTAKRLLSPRAHLEKRLGTSLQADEYCKKDGDFETLGEISVPNQGRRNDLEEVRSEIVSGLPRVQRWNNNFSAYARYYRAFERYENLLISARDPSVPPSVICYWGSTGTGKTRSVWENAPNPEDVWVYPGEGWFDGYAGQRIALFDDFRGSCLKVQLLLQVLDRYPMSVRVKGSHVTWAPQEIYITSNVRPDEWYPNCSMATQAALLRRFTNIVEFE